MIFFFCSKHAGDYGCCISIQFTTLLHVITPTMVKEFNNELNISNACKYSSIYIAQIDVCSSAWDTQMRI